MTSAPSTPLEVVEAPRKDADGVQSIDEKVTGTIDCAETPPEPPYSIFTNREKRWISCVASIGAMFSTLMSYIYFPAIVPMSNDLGVSVSLINLTVTSYLIVAGVAPAFMGDLGDQGGRRPAYILMFTLVLVSNMGLSLQKSYAALFVLRMVQSAGSSGTPLCIHPRPILTRIDRLVWRRVRNCFRHHHCGRERIVCWISHLLVWLTGPDSDGLGPD